MKKGRICTFLLSIITLISAFGISACNGGAAASNNSNSLTSSSGAQNSATSDSTIGDPSCEHEYEDGVCSVCGVEDPDYVPADGGKSMYKEIVDKFKSLILYKYVNEELPPKGENEPSYVDALYEVATEYTPAIDMGYAYKDVNNDRYVELLLMGKDSRLYAMFTIVDDAPAFVATFQQGMGYLGPDGMVFYNTKTLDENNSQIALGNHMMKLVGDKLVGFEYGWKDTDKDITTSEDTVYYCKTEAEGEKTLTYDEYKVYRDHVYPYYWDYPTRLTKLNNLRFTSALMDTQTAQIVANFSTYDGIVKTFEQMFLNVAACKYVRTNWTKGAYDDAMIIRSDKDYAIYNQLIAACVLVQNSSSALFGHALKDLNGDGVDELILLESKYYVLAIFTQVDGKPVLLDTYNDRRTACIDEEGNIHVKQRMIPGEKKDYEYYVYTVDAGALVSEIAIGVKYDAEGNQNAWYQIENGTKTDIAQTKWDGLYAEYLSDIGTTSFHTYTENNANLDLVIIPIPEEEE